MAEDDAVQKMQREAQAAARQERAAIDKEAAEIYAGTQPDWEVVNHAISLSAVVKRGPTTPEATLRFQAALKTLEESLPKLFEDLLKECLGADRVVSVESILERMKNAPRG